jgi:hypothetical protein
LVAVGVVQAEDAGAEVESAMRIGLRESHFDEADQQAAHRRFGQAQPGLDIDLTQLPWRRRDFVERFRGASQNLDALVGSPRIGPVTGH